MKLGLYRYIHSIWWTVWNRKRLWSHIFIILFDNPYDLAFIGQKFNWGVSSSKHG